MYLRNKTYAEYIEFIKSSQLPLGFVTVNPYVKDTYNKFIRTYQALQRVYPNSIYYLRGMNVLISSHRLPTRRDYERGKRRYEDYANDKRRSDMHI